QKSTTVTIERKSGAAKKEASAPATITHHATVIGAVDRAKLEGPLATGGVKLWVYTVGDPKLAGRPDLAERARALGGSCIIVSDAQGNVVASQALAPAGGEAVVLDVVRKALGGG